MNENIKEFFESLYPGDPRVRILLGMQEPPAKGGYIRKSCFAYTLYVRGSYLLFHTLTGQLLLLPPQYIDYFSGERVFPSSVLEQEGPAKLYESWFLVPEDADEGQRYLELKDILVLKEELPRAINHYVILPTSACNARCFYCFEQGMRYHRMTDETVEDTLHFILLHRPQDGRPIHIHWFGGEPLCAAENIDRICAGLSEAGVDFTAEMTSNGSLFTPELAKRAAEVWKLGKIQITLDGMAEEYAKRKRYSGSFPDPFGTVIRNIHRLIAAGIFISVRLNVDENNLGEIYRVVDYLREEFDETEREKLQVYAHSLFGHSGEGLDGCPADAGSDALEERVLEMTDYIYRKGLSVWDLDELFRFKTHYCMVTAPECNILIDAEGGLFACDAMPESMRYGDVRTGIDEKAWKRVTAPCPVRQECGKCVFLPKCTEFDRCPNRLPHDACLRQEKRKLESNLRFAFAVYQDQKK